jgi:hypothetical protein
MVLPPNINILGTTYSVVVCDLGEHLDGFTEPSQRTIKVDSKLRQDAQVETFYHELIHAMMAHVGLSSLLKERKEEAIAQGLGMALAYVVTANELPRLEAVE